MLLIVALATGVAACNNNGGDNPPPYNYSRPENPNIDQSYVKTSDVLIVYFSKTNTTQSVAKSIQELTGADIFEIERKEPYPEAYTPTTEVAEAEKNANARPELKAYLPDTVIAQYETIILGFPIWWHTAPMPVLSFLNYYDLNGKNIITFCTSGGSGIDESTEDIKSNAKGATVTEGRRFSGASDGNIRSWLEELHLLKDNENQPSAPSKQVLVAYFSWGGTTRRIAENLGDKLTGSTVWEIVPAVPYSTDYNEVAYGRAKEEADGNARPEISGRVENMKGYDAVILCYPIWWHTAPMIVGTFLESYDFSGKDIYPVSQSASMSASQYEESVWFIKTCATGATVHDGVFSRDNSVIESYFAAQGLAA